MYLKTMNEEDVIVEVSSEAAENILSILRFDKKDDDVMERLHVFSDTFINFLTNAMQVVMNPRIIVLTKNEARETIFEFIYYIAHTFNKAMIADIRGSANSRYAALLGKNGLIPRMGAMDIIPKAITDIIYNPTCNIDSAMLLLENAIESMTGARIRRTFVYTFGRYHASRMTKRLEADENRNVSNIAAKAKIHSAERKVVVKKAISIKHDIIDADADSDWDDDELNDPNPANTDLMHDVDDDEDDEDDYVPNTGYNQDVHDPVGDAHLSVTRNNVNALWYNVSKMETPRRAAWQEVLAQTFTKAINEGKAPMDLLFLDSHGHLCWRSDKPVWEIEGIDPMDYCNKLSYEASVDYNNIMHCAQNPDVIVLGRMDAIALASIFEQTLEMNGGVSDVDLWGNRALATERLYDVLIGYVYDFDGSEADEDDDK